MWNIKACNIYSSYEFIQNNSDKPITSRQIFIIENIASFFFSFRGRNLICEQWEWREGRTETAPLEGTRETGCPREQRDTGEGVQEGLGVLRAPWLLFVWWKPAEDLPHRCPLTNQNMVGHFLCYPPAGIRESSIHINRNFGETSGVVLYLKKKSIESLDL